MNMFKAIAMPTALIGAPFFGREIPATAAPSAEDVADTSITDGPMSIRGGRP